MDETTLRKTTCVYCHDRLSEEEESTCQQCEAPHHEECFAEHGGCATLGCQSKRLVGPDGQLRPQRVRRPRRRQRRRRNGQEPSFRERRPRRGRIHSFRGELDNAALTALILGIAGLVFFSPLGIVAVVKSFEARQLARRFGVQVPGSAQVGGILGWLSIVIMGFWVLLIGLIMVAGAL